MEESDSFFKETTYWTAPELRKSVILSRVVFFQTDLSTVQARLALEYASCIRAVGIDIELPKLLDSGNQNMYLFSCYLMPCHNDQKTTKG